PGSSSAPGSRAVTATGTSGSRASTRSPSSTAAARRRRSSSRSPARSRAACARRSGWSWRPSRSSRATSGDPRPALGRGGRRRPLLADALRGALAVAQHLLLLLEVVLEELHDLALADGARQFDQVLVGADLVVLDARGDA